MDWRGFGLLVIFIAAGVMLHDPETLALKAMALHGQVR